jgi:hypothetical protein
MRAKLLLVVLLALGLLASGAGVASADGDDNPLYPLDTYPPTPSDNAVLKWNEEALECIRATKPGPTVVARSLFVLHSSVYDAWSAYDAKAVPTVRTGFARRPSSQRTLANKSQTVSHAAYVALSDLFPACRAEFDERLRSMGYRADDAATAAADGRRAGGNVVAARRDDGANQAGGYADTTGYTPVNTPETVTDPWRWQPLRVPLGDPQGTAQQPLTPQWGRVRPFDPKLLEQSRQIPTPSRSPSKSVDDILRESANLDDRDKVIAEYWADGPRSELPPGHWNLFAQWLSRRYRQSIDADAKMFLGLNGALLDASIGAWDAKYRMDFARPVTTIRALRAGQTVRAWGGPYQGTQLIPGETWKPYQPVDFPTPPFPEYISGHSTFSAAAAAFLKDFGAVQGRDGDVFGASVTIEAGTSRVEPRTATHPGVPASDITLAWPSFTDAADEAGISRRYGGIHWIDGDVYARDLGKKIGESSFSIAKKLWEGG